MKYYIVGIIQKARNGRGVSAFFVTNRYENFRG